MSQTEQENTNINLELDTNVDSTDAVLVHNQTTETTTTETPIPTESKPKPVYEVVFFVRYPHGLRPTADKIISTFSNYGTVDHIKDPENRDFVYVFMSSLSTTAEHRRTRTTISEIIKNMPTEKENKFYITVASSNRNQKGSNNNNNNNTNRNSYNNRVSNRGRGGFARVTKN